MQVDHARGLLEAGHADEVEPNHWPRMHGKAATKLRNLTVRLGSYVAGDVRDYLAKVVPQDAAVVMFPPFYGGYCEAQFTSTPTSARAAHAPETAESLTKNDRYVRDVAVAIKWCERAEAYDRHLDKLYEQAWLEERRKAAEADAKILGAAVGKIAQRLPALRAEDLSAGDLIRLLDVTMRHRRGLFGDPTLTVAVTGPRGDPLIVQLADFANLAPEERRRRLADLVAAMGCRVAAEGGGEDEVYPAGDDDGLDETPATPWAHPSSPHRRCRGPGWRASSPWAHQR
ncbi:hypothetical protein ACIBG7_27275 [Nonomuraea sp. NPDC050328]|uniref:putative antirestriction adenine methyltransferase n=1 Tax=Nonomuraea sp. NPDC050328 TaxID=3364361 RepID=UPI0037A8F7D7